MKGLGLHLFVDYDMYEGRFSKRKIIFDFCWREIIHTPFTIMCIVALVFFPLMTFNGSFDVEDHEDLFALVAAVEIVYLLIIIASRILIWIGVGMFVKNCDLMEAEWKNDPPERIKMLRQKQAQEKRLQEERLAAERAAQEIVDKKQKTKNLLEQCGMKFFLKYYKMISALPLRDVAVEEEFSPEEKNERLQAAKKLIDEDLSVYAAQYILDNFSEYMLYREKSIAEEIIAKK